MCDKVGAAADFSTAVTPTADTPLKRTDLTETVINTCEQFVLMQSVHEDPCWLT